MRGKPNGVVHSSCLVAVLFSTLGLLPRPGQAAAVPGSGLLKGFWASLQDPALVLRCSEPEICPGGLPESCSEERSGVACSECRDPQQVPGAFGGACLACQDLALAGCGTLLLVLLLLVFVPLPWSALYACGEVAEKEGGEGGCSTDRECQLGLTRQWQTAVSVHMAIHALQGAALTVDAARRFSPAVVEVLGQNLQLVLAVVLFDAQALLPSCVLSTVGWELDLPEAGVVLSWCLPTLWLICLVLLIALVHFMRSLRRICPDGSKRNSRVRVDPILPEPAEQQKIQRTTSWQRALGCLARQRPAAAPAAALAALLRSPLLARLPRRAQAFDCLDVSLYVFLAPLAKLSLRAFECDEHPGGSATLAGQPGLRCGEARGELLAGAVPLLLLYMVVPVCYLAQRLARDLRSEAAAGRGRCRLEVPQRSRGSVTSTASNKESSTVNPSLLQLQVRPKFWWWPIVVVTRSMLLPTVTALASPAAALFGLLTLEVLYWVALCRAWPWCSPGLNRFDCALSALNSGASIAAVAASLGDPALAHSTMPMASVEQASFTYLLLLLVILVGIISVVQILWLQRSEPDIAEVRAEDMADKISLATDLMQIALRVSAAEHVGYRQVIDSIPREERAMVRASTALVRRRFLSNPTSQTNLELQRWQSLEALCQEWMQQFFTAVDEPVGPGSEDSQNLDGLESVICSRRGSRRESKQSLLSKQDSNVSSIASAVSLREIWGWPREASDGAVGSTMGSRRNSRSQSSRRNSVRRESLRCDPLKLDSRNHSRRNTLLRSQTTGTCRPEQGSIGEMRRVSSLVPVQPERKQEEDKAVAEAEAEVFGHTNSGGQQRVPAVEDSSSERPTTEEPVIRLSTGASEVDPELELLGRARATSDASGTDTVQPLELQEALQWLAAQEAQPSTLTAAEASAGSSAGPEQDAQPSTPRVAEAGGGHPAEPEQASTPAEKDEAIAKWQERHLKKSEAAPSDDLDSAMAKWKERKRKKKEAREAAHTGYGHFLRGMHEADPHKGAASAPRAGEAAACSSCSAEEASAEDASAEKPPRGKPPAAAPVAAGGAIVAVETTAMQRLFGARGLLRGASGGSIGSNHSRRSVGSAGAAQGQQRDQQNDPFQNPVAQKEHGDPKEWKKWMRSASVSLFKRYNRRDAKRASRSQETLPTPWLQEDSPFTSESAEQSPKVPNVVVTWSSAGSPSSGTEKAATPAHQEAGGAPAAAGRGHDAAAPGEGRPGGGAAAADGAEPASEGEKESSMFQRLRRSIKLMLPNLSVHPHVEPQIPEDTEAQALPEDTQDSSFLDSFRIPSMLPESGLSTVCESREMSRRGSEATHPGNGSSRRTSAMSHGALAPGRIMFSSGMVDFPEGEMLADEASTLGLSRRESCISLQVPRGDSLGPSRRESCSSLQVSGFPLPSKRFSLGPGAHLQPLEELPNQQDAVLPTQHEGPRPGDDNSDNSSGGEREAEIASGSSARQRTVSAVLPSEGLRRFSGFASDLLRRRSLQNFRGNFKQRSSFKGTLPPTSEHESQPSAAGVPAEGAPGMESTTCATIADTPGPAPRTHTPTTESRRDPVYGGAATAINRRASAQIGGDWLLPQNSMLRLVTSQVARVTFEDAPRVAVEEEAPCHRSEEEEAQEPMQRDSLEEEKAERKARARGRRGCPRARMSSFGNLSATASQCSESTAVMLEKQLKEIATDEVAQLEEVLQNIGMNTNQGAPESTYCITDDNGDKAKARHSYRAGTAGSSSACASGSGGAGEVPSNTTSTTASSSSSGGAHGGASSAQVCTVRQLSSQLSRVSSDESGGGAASSSLGAEAASQAERRRAAEPAEASRSPPTSDSMQEKKEKWQERRDQKRRRRVERRQVPSAGSAQKDWKRTYGSMIRQEACAMKQEVSGRGSGTGSTAGLMGGLDRSAFNSDHSSGRSPSSISNCSQASHCSSIHSLLTDRSARADSVSMRSPNPEGGGAPAEEQSDNPRRRWS